MERSPPGLIRSTIYPLCFFHLDLSLCLWSLCLWWLLNDCLEAGKLSAAVLSAYSFSTDLLNSASPLSPVFLAACCLICASPCHCCTSADNTGGGSGGPGLPGNSLTDHLAAVTCCILSRSACSSLCALWGDTFSVGSSDVHRYYVKSREVGDTINLCDPGSRVSVCMFRCMIPIN